jgi:hypothetical protein
MAALRSFDERLYRHALLLYPPAFQREFAPEMLVDFESGRLDALAAGRPSAVWRFRRQMVHDLLVTLVMQWIRSGWPIILLLAAAAPAVLAAGLASVWPPRMLAFPEGGADLEAFAAVMLTMFVLLLIATIILITSWSAHFTRHRGRRM